MLNKAIIIGNLGTDPESRSTNGGTSVTKFRVATTFKWKDKEETEWHSIVCFGKLADVCAKYLHKGKQVYVEGRIQTRSYTDKENVKRWSTEIVAQEVKFLGGAPSSNGRNNSNDRDNTFDNPFDDDKSEDDGDMPF